MAVVTEVLERATPRAHWLLRNAGLMLACALLVRLGLTTADDHRLIATFAPAVGLTWAALMRWGPAVTPGLWIGLAAGFIWGGASWSLAIALATGQALGACIAAFWLGRSGFNPRLEQPRDLWLLLGAVLCGGAVLSSANAATWLMLAGRITPIDLAGAWLGWWFGEAVGLLVVGVALLALPRLTLGEPGTQRWIGDAALLLAIALSLGLVIDALANGRLSLLPFAVLPLVALAWLALRGGLALPTAGLAVLGLLTAALLVSGSRPLQSVADTLGARSMWACLALAQALVLLVHVFAGRARNAANRFELALGGADLGVAEWPLGSGVPYTSPRWRTLLGDRDGTRTSTLDAWLARVHGDDRNDLQLAIESLDESGHDSVWRQVRIRVGDAWPWFELRVSVAARDGEQRATRLVATLSDVQERRSAEDRERLSSSLFQNLHEGLVVVDADLRILDVNPTYSRITGIAREELIGTVPTLLSSSSTDAMTRQQQSAIWAGLRSLGHWSGEVVERRRNGDPCALHLSVFTVPDPEGAVRYRVLMVSDITEQRLQRERLERQAHFDELTRLPNRARLTQLLSEALVVSEREGHLLAVCYIDLDHFKEINERYGRSAGDRLLVELAARLRSALRAHATWSDVAARLGGDEFVLLLRADTVDEARLAVERLLRVIAQPYTLDSQAQPTAMTASVGATVYPIDRSDPDTLLRHADHAMYGAKQAGRNGYLFFDAEHNRRAEERVLALGRVQEALDRQELRLYFQPKVDLRRGTVLGAEALLRWEHPDHGVVPPGSFLPLIEHTGLSARVGDWVLSQALNQLERWLDQGLDLSVSVNVSARHLQEPDFVQRLTELLARHTRALGPRLELEVLETAALADVAYTSMLLERCASLGVRFALDDFGTGYSTLTYLKRLPVQVLKIDRSFVHNMLNDTQDRAIVEGVISLARTFSCVAVAEGVETPAQARTLLEMGCEVGQGAGIAAPMPAADLARWIKEWKGLFAIAPASITPALGSAAAQMAGPRSL
jgi:diguanylate cyclase (GGDEF)-like protein/PAS domain S-box-containing protein